MTAPTPPRWKPVHTCFMWLVGCPAALGLVAIVLSLTTYHERTSKRMELDAMLKQDMLQRGFTAQEIEAVLRATSDEDRSHVGQDYMKQQLIRDLKRQGMKAEDIERVVRAAYPQAQAPTPKPVAPPPVRSTVTVTAPPSEVAEPAGPPQARPAMPFSRN